MYEDATVIHLATCLANLANAQAAAPYASPSFAGQDAVTRATKEVVEAAQMLVRAAATYRAREAHRAPAPPPTRPTPQLLRLGATVLSLDHCLQFEDQGLATRIWVSAGRSFLFGEPYHSGIQAWLNQHATVMDASGRLALVAEEEE